MTTIRTKQEVTIHYLKMVKKPDTTTPTDHQLSLKKLHQIIDPEYYLKLYNAVGDSFQWTDRLGLSHKELAKEINDSRTTIYLLQYQGKTVGYSELVQEKEYVELLYFGLFFSEIGKGLGPTFLQLIIAQAWELNPQWVQLNTCTLDHPKALSLYQQIGFKPVKRKQVLK